MTLQCLTYESACNYYFNGGTPLPADKLNISEKDDVSVNHPLYNKMIRSWKVMRHAAEGQDAVREHALKMDYIQIPPGIADIPGSKRSQLLNSTHHKTAQYHYINKAHYIPIVSRIIEEIVGKIFSKHYKIEIPKKLSDIIDELDSEGLSFEEYVRWVVREVFTVTRFGTLADWDEKTKKPVIKRYTTESIVNWNTDERGELILLVLQDMVRDKSQIFSHNSKTRRITFTLEEDARGKKRVVQRTWVKNANTDKFEEIEEPVVLSRRGRQLTKIPFIFFGGIKPESPILRPLADTALEFFDAHAQYRNTCWWAATAQPVITFKNGGGFYEADKSRGEDNDKSAPDDELNIILGSSTPIILEDGEFKFVETSGQSISAQRQRLTDIRAEMTGMGARSFNAQTASNIKVQTERMQNRSEGSIIQSISKFISRGIANTLQVVAAWADIKGEIEFELNKDYVEDFEVKYLPELMDAVDKNYLSRKGFFEYLQKNSELIGDNVKYEAYIAEIERNIMSSLVFNNGDVDNTDNDIDKAILNTEEDPDYIEEPEDVRRPT